MMIWRLSVGAVKPAAILNQLKVDPQIKSRKFKV
jgi:hypothetical protein